MNNTCSHTVSSQNIMQKRKRKCRHCRDRWAVTPI